MSNILRSLNMLTNVNNNLTDSNCNKQYVIYYGNETCQ